MWVFQPQLCTQYVLSAGILASLSAKYKGAFTKWMQGNKNNTILRKDYHTTYNISAAIEPALILQAFTLNRSDPHAVSTGQRLRVFTAV